MIHEPKGEMHMRLMKSVRSNLTHGKKRWLKAYLDRWASRRILARMIDKTDNFQNVRWLGAMMWQFPISAWVLQEVVSETKPDIIIETGTYSGGSAYFLASLCDLLGRGEIVSIDIEPRSTIPHPRITYLTASSVDPAAVNLVRQRIERIKAKTILLILDSDHRMAHVLRELESYAPLIPVGSYIHVQDGCIDELDCLRVDRPGPKEAAKSFLRDHPEFVRDEEIESRYVLTFCPYGWLKRVRSD